MLGSAEPPRRIQIGFPSSETKKKKKKKFLYLNSYFPLQPVPTLLDSTVPYLDNVLMSCTTWSKIAQLGSYPGIIKCPWVLASTLHNWREEREVGGGGEDQSDNVQCCDSAAEWLESVTAPVRGHHLQRGHGERRRRLEGGVVCAGGRRNCSSHNTCWFARW